MLTTYREIRYKCVRMVIAGAGLLTIVALLSACALVPEEDRALVPPLVRPAEVSAPTAEVEINSLVKFVTGSASFESTKVTHYQFGKNGGRLDELLVQAGDHVQKGTPMLRLQTEGLDLQLLHRQVDVEKRKLALDEAKVSQDSRRIHIAELELQIASIGLKEVEGQLQGKDIVSEVDGVVTFVANVKPGDLIEPFFSAITVADPAEMRLVLSSINADQLKDVKEGMMAEISYEGSTYIGNVVQTPASAPYVDDERMREQYSKALYIKLEELPEKAKLGSMASVNIVTGQRDDVLVIPTTALRRNFGRTYVHVLEGERRREVDVQIGMETSSQVEITAGLDVGQLVIAR